MDRIFELIRERFPLLQRLLVQSADGNEIPERLPPFLGLLFAVMEAPWGHPTCFVFPRRGEIGRLATVLHALQQFAKEQQQVTRQYIDAHFNEGDIVRVTPGKHVFRYGGFDIDAQDFIRLEALHKTGGSRRVRAVDIMNRLEKAKLKKPLGSLASEIHATPREPIDELLGTASYGNQSRIKNAVVLLDSQRGLKETAESVALLLDGSTTPSSILERLLPFGQLTQPRSMPQEWFLKWQDHNPTGEPLVAVTHSAELLANYCLSVPTRSKLVVANGLSRLRNLQAYDEISATQNLVLLADLEDEEMIQVLGQRGCRFWWLTGSEMGTSGHPAVNQSRGLIGEVIRWSHNFDHSVLEAEKCESHELEGVYFHLEQLRDSVNSNPDGPLTKLASRGWRILNDLCAVIDTPAEAESQRRREHVAVLRRELEVNKVWLSQESIVALTNVADKLDAVMAAPTRLGVSKGEALLRLLEEAVKADLRCAVVARNEGQVDGLKIWLRQHGLASKVKTYSPRTLPDDGDFRYLICVSWLGFNHMRQIAVSLMTPHLMILAYPFEQRWLKQFEHRMETRPPVPCVSSAEKTALFVAEGRTPWPGEPTPEIPAARGVVMEADAFLFESRLQSARKGVAATPTSAVETVPSRYVSFFGESFVFLTASHKVPVATEFVSKGTRPNRQLLERVVDDFKQGDFIVFPESGDRELIQEVADKLLGQRASGFRTTAHLWKDALWKCGISPEAFVLHAKELGRPRHVATIRHWFSDSSQIGPQTEDDLALIQIVTSNNELEQRAGDVWRAIEQLRGAHLSAGNRLRDALLQRLPTVIGDIEENGTKVNLGELGSAWVVQVESVASETEPRGHREVNRLLWEQTTLDLSAFL
jgi:hypothetical protein